MKDSFYDELEFVFEKFSKYHMEILLGNFNAKIGRKHIFKQTTENECVHEINNNIGVRIVNIPTSKNMIVKTFLTFINLLENLLIDSTRAVP
jgi:hypothetical protein